MKKKLHVLEISLVEFVAGTILFTSTIFNAIQGVAGGVEIFGGQVGVVLGAIIGGVLGFGVGAAFVICLYGLIMLVDRNIDVTYENKVIKDAESPASEKIDVSVSFRYRLLLLATFLYPPKTQKEIFKPIIGDWEEEHFEAESKKEVWKVRWLNIRYTYAFFGAMFQKSPVIDFIKFVIKMIVQFIPKF